MKDDIMTKFVGLRAKAFVPKTQKSVSQKENLNLENIKIIQKQLIDSLKKIIKNSQETTE